MVRRKAQQLFQKKNAGYTDDRQKKAEKESSSWTVTAFRKYSTRNFTMLFVESRDFLFYPARDIGGSVFNPDLFRFSATQELHSRPIHERDVP
jgi:hypothetical protein